MPSRSISPGLFAESSAKPPSTGWITAHCDGGARGNPGPAGYGAEITDANGNVIAELSEFLGIRTNNYAEYSGLLASLAWALEHGHRRLRVVSDSELMVKQIQGKYKVNSPDLKPLWQEARSRIARLEAFEITHALRHKNKAADALANQAMDRGMNRGPAAIPTPRPATTHPSASPPAASHLRVGSGPAPIPIPYPTKSEASVQPSTAAKPAAMLRGFTRNGVVHILGGASLPDGIFVKIIPE
jgi:ribonuclease HI